MCELVLLFCLSSPSGDIHNLGDNSYRVRAAAHRRLEKEGWKAYPYLLSVRGRNAEAERRREILLKHYRHWYDNPLPDGHKVPPGICSLDRLNFDPIPVGSYSSASDIIEHYSHVQTTWTLWGHEGTIDLNHATRLYCLDLLRAGVPRHRIVELLNHMVREQPQCENSSAH